ncbi:MAG TPA: hypothetical protein ENH97_03340 [bacterium]|nr:hypothetical protein [bacterium]
MRIVKIFVLMLVSILLTSAAFAQRKAVITPDHPAYKNKLAAEARKFKKAKTLEEKALARTEFANRRVAEMEAVVKKGKPEYVEGLAKRYNRAIEKANQTIEKGMREGKDMTKALQAVDKGTAKHLEVLKRVLNKAPKQAKPALRHALQVSRHGRETALSNLQKQRRKPAKPKGKLEKKRRFRRRGKPEGKGGLKGRGGGRGKK